MCLIKKGHGVCHVLFLLAHTLPQVLAEKLLDWNVCGRKSAVSGCFSRSNGSSRLRRKTFCGANHGISVGAIIGGTRALPGNRACAHGIVAERSCGGSASHKIFVAALGTRSQNVIKIGRATC